MSGNRGTGKLAKSSMPRPNIKKRIVAHYNRVSPYYRALWGEHLHHGYWIRGDESKDAAQLQLVEHLAQTADLPPGATILDIGCGFGASSISLPQKYRAGPPVIPIPPVQTEPPKAAAAQAAVSANFLLM